MNGVERSKGRAQQSWGADLIINPGEQQAASAAALGALDRMVRVLGNANGNGNANGMLRHACRCRFILYTGASPRCHGPLEHDIVSRRPRPSTMVPANRRRPSFVQRAQKRVMTGRHDCSQAQERLLQSLQRSSDEHVSLRAGSDCARPDSNTPGISASSWCRELGSQHSVDHGSVTGTMLRLGASGVRVHL